MKHILSVVVLAVFLGVEWVDSSQQVVKDMSLNYIKALGVCKKEMSLPDSVDEDFRNFWKDGYELNNRFTGCAFICLSSKLNLIDPEGQLHHGNAHEYVKSHGADDDVAKQLVTFWHDCSTSTAVIDDKCAMVVNIAKCFKAEVHKLNWAPDMDALMAEALAEI